MQLSQLQNNVRRLSGLCTEFNTDFAPHVFNGFAAELRGFGHSTLSLAVHKETDPVEFAIEQATFMLFLGENVCPRILSINDVSYVMEYLQPAKPTERSIRIQELFLGAYVWSRQLDDVPYAKQIGDESWREQLAESIDIRVPDWALDTPCLIHGDPTLDNTLITKQGLMRIADPIPPHRLIRPSIKAVDHGKMLQSLLGWEVVLRGMPKIDYIQPGFMENYDSARRAVFWCVVALKRIALRNNTSNAGQWAEAIAQELASCVF